MQGPSVFSNTFRFGTGRIAWEGGWFKVQAPVAEIKFKGQREVILRSPSAGFLVPQDIIPIVCDVIELCDSIGTMDFGTMRFRMRQGGNSVFFEIESGAFSRYDIPAEPDNLESSVSSVSVIRQERCSRLQCPRHGPQGVHTRFAPGEVVVAGPIGAPVTLDEAEAKYEHVIGSDAIEAPSAPPTGNMYPLTGLISLTGDNTRYQASPPSLGLLHPLAPSGLDILGRRQPSYAAIPLPVSTNTVPVMMGMANLVRHAHNLRQPCNQERDPFRLDPMDYMSDSATLTAPSEEQCVICRETYEVGELKKWLPCAHGFHAHCIDRWVTMPRAHGVHVLADCPTCKVPLDELASRAVNGHTAMDREDERLASGFDQL